MTDVFEAFAEQSATLGKYLQHHGVLLSTAESCTGGMLGAIITMTPGSSQWYDRGFITYSNEAKMAMLEVGSNTLDKHGAVSEEVAIQMAEGALFKAPESTLAVSVTGVAGPSGGTADKPVGMVCFALAKRVAIISFCSARTSQIIVASSGIAFVTPELQSNCVGLIL